MNGHDLFNGLACFVGLIWLIRLIAMNRIFRKRLILNPDSPTLLQDRPEKISVIVAAKDEEDNIERCVRTLMQQDFPNLEVVAVDDRSDDRTPQILADLKKEFGDRLKIVTIDHVPAGWYGKQNAMVNGVREADGDWLLFTDADCSFDATKTLSVGLADALAHECDFLSITPVCTTETWWERILQPASTTILIVWFLPERVNNPKTRTAYANGAFMLVNRRCYESIGGHGAVRHLINEDIQLADAAKKAGFKLRVVENEGLYHTRMYESASQAWRGWTRIFYGSLRTSLRVGLAMTVVFISSLLPWIGVAVSLGFLLTGSATRAEWTTSMSLFAGAAILQLAVMWFVYRIMRIRSFWALTYPLGATAAFAMLVNALLTTLGAVKMTWRGTTYSGNGPNIDKTSKPVMIKAVEETTV